MIDTGVPCLRQAGRRLLAVFVVSMMPSACNQIPSPSTEDFDRQVSNLQAVTAVDGTHVRPPSAVVHGPVSLRVTWEVEGQPELTWERYRDAVTKRLASESELHPTETSDGSLLFMRTLPGDTHTLRIERPSSGTTLRVLVTFTAAAD